MYAVIVITISKHSSDKQHTCVQCDIVLIRLYVLKISIPHFRHEVSVVVLGNHGKAGL